jgi:hypothetical protein
MEEMDLKDCLLSGSEISSSSLKTLAMVNCTMFWGLTISAPNLVLLHCVKPIGQAPSFKNLDSLVSGTIILDDYLFSADFEDFSQLDETTDDILTVMMMITVMPTRKGSTRLGMNLFSPRKGTDLAVTMIVKSMTVILTAMTILISTMRLQMNLMSPVMIVLDIVLRKMAAVRSILEILVPMTL